jgi:hypothetical protein
MAAKAEKIPVSPVGVVSYPSLIQANQWGKRAVTLIFPAGADTAELETLIEKAADEKWPPKKTSNGQIIRKRPANFHHPIRDNAEKEGDDGYAEGGTFAKFQTTDRVKTFYPDGSGPLDQGDIYPGMLGRCSYVARAYSKDGGNGVRLQLINFQKAGEGEPIGGGVRSEGDEFDSIDLTDDPDMAAALGDDIPF